MICRSCGTANPDSSRYCNGCGGRLEPQRLPQRKICPHCGASNPEYAQFCMNCAKDLTPPPTTGPQRTCAWCGAVVGPTDRICGRCSHDPSGLSSTTPELPFRTQKPIIAGIVLVGSGLLDIMSGVRLLTADVNVSEVPIDITGMLQTCGVLAIIFGIAALFGAWFSITRESFTLAVLAAALGMVGVGPFYLGAILGLAGLVLLVISREEFPD